jgi:hypothetical protein
VGEITYSVKFSVRFELELDTKRVVSEMSCGTIKYINSEMEMVNNNIY